MYQERKPKAPQLLVALAVAVRSHLGRPCDCLTGARRLNAVIVTTLTSR